MRSTTSSPALEAGLTLSDLLDGPTTSQYGPGVVPVNHSAPPASAKASPTSATCGPCGSALFSSADLQSCLESRLRVHLNGSDLCEVIWKPWATPWGATLSKPRARVRTISATDIGLWQSPTAKANQDSPSMAKWPGSVAASVWPTAKSSDDRIGMADRFKGPMSDNGRRSNLNDAAAMQVAVWATATSHERTHTARKVHHGEQLANQASGLSAPTEKRGALNPEFVCWLMGYPAEWVNCAGSETPSTRGRQRRSSEAQCLQDLLQ